MLFLLVFFLYLVHSSAHGPRHHQRRGQAKPRDLSHDHAPILVVVPAAGRVVMMVVMVMVMVVVVVML